MMNNEILFANCKASKEQKNQFPTDKGHIKVPQNSFDATNMLVTRNYLLVRNIYLFYLKKTTFLCATQTD